MTDQAKGESAKAFQLQLKPHLKKENVAKKVIVKEDQSEEAKEMKNTKVQHEAMSTEMNNSQFNPLDVIKSLAEMKPIVIIKKDTPPPVQSNSRNNSYSNQRSTINRQQTANFYPDPNLLSKSDIFKLANPTKQENKKLKMQISELTLKN